MQYCLCFGYVWFVSIKLVKTNCLVYIYMFFNNFIVAIKMKGHDNIITTQRGVKHLFISLISSVFL